MRAVLTLLALAGSLHAGAITSAVIEISEAGYLTWSGGIQPHFAGLDDRGAAFSVDLHYTPQTWKCKTNALGREVCFSGSLIDRTTGIYDGQDFAGLDVLLGLWLMFDAHEHVSGTVPFVVHSSAMGFYKGSEDFLFSMNECVREGLANFRYREDGSFAGVDLFVNVAPFNLWDAWNAQQKALEDGAQTPEPGTLALGGAGLAAIGLWDRRRGARLPRRQA
ncbi:MAG: PEP-CTERM sorting domain-containing protein [Bryobacteraceae bacterium]|nr:PEP-CTERM sorting domain-containing protein [Bryobacteraceae bacterium]